MTRISESDLILPALFVINNKPNVTTSELIFALREIFKPTGEDVELLQGRNDDKFSQIVRNLVSHHTLDKRYEYTTISEIDDKNAKHTITKTGLNYLNSNKESVEVLVSNDLDYSGVIEGVSAIQKAYENDESITILDENIMISEGRKKIVSTSSYSRSGILRDKAIDSFTKNGKIVCEVCGFDFYKKYGELGRGFIELHHLKPIYLYSDNDINKFICDAIKELVPLCSNCHRMLHRRRENPITVDELKNNIKK